MPAIFRVLGFLYYGTLKKNLQLIYHIFINKITLSEAARIKDRGFTIVSVGISSGTSEEARIKELLEISSSYNDNFYVDNSDGLMQILPSLAKLVCQKSVQILQQQNVLGSVGKNGYKYFRVLLGESIGIGARFTVELALVKGRSELYHSFSDENPKSGVNYIQGSRIVNMSDLNVEKKYYDVERPGEKPNEVLFFSVLGLSESENEFRVYVYDKVVIGNGSIKMQYHLMTTLFCLGFNLWLMMV